MHDGFKESNWTDQEVGFAMGRGLPVFSIRFDQDPYGFIGRFQAFNGNGKTVENLAREIFDGEHYQFVKAALLICESCSFGCLCV